MANISYIAATRNRCSYLRSALDSWAALKGPDDELIVVDGASCDGTVELLRQRSDIVDAWISEPDVSEAHALNKGILRASGRYLKFLTDDDRLYRPALAQAVAALEAHPELDVVHAGGECRAVADDGTSRLVWYQQWEGRTDRVWWMSRCGLGAVVRRTACARFGLFDVRHRLADTSFFIQATQRGAKPGFLQVLAFTHLRGAVSYTGNAHDSAMRGHVRRMAREHGLSLGEYLTFRYPRFGTLRRSPGAAWRAIARRLGRQDARLPDPVWDGGLYDGDGRRIGSFPIANTGKA